MSGAVQAACRRSRWRTATDELRDLAMLWALDLALTLASERSRPRLARAVSELARDLQLAIDLGGAGDAGLMVGGIWVLCPFCGEHDPEIEVHGHSQCRRCGGVLRRCCDD